MTADFVFTFFAPRRRAAAVRGAPALELGEVGVVELLRQTPLKADEVGMQ